MVSDFVIGEKGTFSDCAQESFTLPSRYYTDPGIHDQEMSAIFQCSWLYVGHVSDLPDVGSYLTEEVAGQPILIVRSQDNSLRAFFNVCQHRGHTLLSGRGQLKGRIVCPYHAWCYGLDGALLSARMTRDIPNFDLAEFPLKPIQLATAAGLLFVNFDPTASPCLFTHLTLPTILLV